MQQRYSDPLDRLLALAPVHDLQIWHERGHWKARKGAALVELGKTPRQLVERLLVLLGQGKQRGELPMGEYAAVWEQDPRTLDFGGCEK